MPDMDNRRQNKADKVNASLRAGLIFNALQIYFSNWLKVVTGPTSIGGVLVTIRRVHASLKYKGKF